MMLFNSIPLETKQTETTGFKLLTLGKIFDAVFILRSLLEWEAALVRGNLIDIYTCCFVSQSTKDILKPMFQENQMDNIA